MRKISIYLLNVVFVLSFAAGANAQVSLIGGWDFEGNLDDRTGVYDGRGFDISFANDAGGNGKSASQVVYLNGEAGGESYVDIPATEISDAFDLQSMTVMVWGKVDTTITQVTELLDEHAALLVKGDTQFRISRRAFEDRMMWNITGNGMGPYDSQTGPENLEDAAGDLVGDWHHYAGTYDATNGEQNFYVDGVLESTRTLDPIGTPSNNTYLIEFGRNQQSVDLGFGGAPRLWIGWIDEGYVLNGALSETQINDIKDNGCNLTRCPELDVSTATYNINTAGQWRAGGSWDTAVPDGNDRTAILGDVIQQPETVYLNTSATVKRIEFNNNDTYAISGPGTLNLDADSGPATIEVFAAGTNDQHEIEVDIVLNDDNLNITAAATTTLDINEPIDLNGQILSLLGAGTINLNSGTTGGGSIAISGTLGTAGASSFGGSLNSTGTIDIDINGFGDLVQYDSLIVSGAATLDGSTIDVDIAAGVATPSSITVLTASSISASGLTLGGPDGGLFTIDQAALANGMLTLLSGSVIGDADGDGDVDGADFLAFQRSNPALIATDWQPNYGNGVGPLGATTAVPEPGCLTLFATALIGLIAKRSGSPRRSPN